MLPDTEYGMCIVYYFIWFWFLIIENESNRTPQLLLSRGPSFPALVLDTSAEFVEENLNRRTAHARIMAESPAAFRRYFPFL